MITPGAAGQLCDMIAGQMPDWRGQDATMSKIEFNATVQDWAARNRGVNVAVMQNRSVIDEVTTAHCPKVRSDTVAALQTPDLASALVGW
ncbi:hypothetical protein NDR87_36920 [Nocardia sp. CDC159]|uniref:hypothetical protein n=1 Tax=Nocardia sp. CDC159 TaxID=2951409 RepID=UPI0020748086|nr:hypothetical protein [Nocardia sp. CDC159]MCM6791961.1 hypothetical protein [Nocardia sp. CDC159]